MTISTQHILDKIRKPRVHITYDVYVGNAIEKKELPFVIGVLANLSGNPEKPLPKLKNRSFVFVDSDNLEEVFAAANPRIKFSVKDVITGSGNTLDIEMKMKSLNDFRPFNIVKAIPLTNKVYQDRVLLNDLFVKLEGNELLRDILKLVAEDPDTRKNLSDIVQNMKKQLAPSVANAQEDLAEAQAKNDVLVDQEVKEEIKAAETKKRAGKPTASRTPAATPKSDVKPQDSENNK